MNHNLSAAVSSQIYAVKIRLVNRSKSFYEFLSPIQRGCFLLGIIPMPVYVFSGQFFLLLDTIRASVEGYSVNVTALFALLVETFLILYTVALIIQFASSRKYQTSKTLSSSTYSRHPCITICPVPLHLYNDERKPISSDEREFVKNFVGTDHEDSSLLDHLPKALDILKNNAAMLEIYEQSHPQEVAVPSVETKSKSLLELLHEKQRPPLETISDLEKIVHSTNT